MSEKPAFIQGVFEFHGEGFDAPRPLSSATPYKVPFDQRSQLVYFRAGNSSAELIYAVLSANGKVKRYFPIGARSAVHVPLAVTEDLQPDTVVEVMVAAPAGVSGTCVIDIGLMEF